MLFKILLIWFGIQVVLEVKGLKNHNKNGNRIKNMIKDSGKNPIVVVFFLSSVIVTISNVIFYTKAYDLSPLIGWLSIIQVFWAIRNFFKTNLIVEEVFTGRYKESSLLEKLFTIAFDSWYLYLVISAII